MTYVRDAILLWTHSVVRTTLKPRGSRQFLAAKRKQLGTDFGHAFLNGKKRLREHLSCEKKAKSSYTHRFVCLSESGQSSIPTTDADKDSLLEAGLGEKKITIPDIDISSNDFHDLYLGGIPKAEGRWRVYVRQVQEQFKGIGASFSIMLNITENTTG